MLQHTFGEIKQQRSKLFNLVSTMQRINRDLAEIINFDDPDMGMREYLVDRYLKTLDIYHVNGRAGSLLDQANVQVVH